MAGKPAEQSRPQTVLIVDDEMDMRIFLSTLFETSGYKPVTTRDGRDGLAKAKTLLPDLIVLDVMMPGEGGALMYKALKSDPQLKKIPVIMLSAVSEASFKYYLKMLAARFQVPVPQPRGYVEKPPDPDALLKLAQSILAAPAETSK